jgi:hypothetical protein
MRIVEYKGSPVKRQKKVGPDQILLIFFTRPPIVVTPEEWSRNRCNRFIDDPAFRRRDVVRQQRSPG